MRRLIITLALAVGMVLGSASVAMAHPNDPAADPSPFLADNAVAKSGLGNAKGPTVTATYELPDGSALPCFALSGTWIRPPTGNGLSI